MNHCLRSITTMFSVLPIYFWLRVMKNLVFVVFLYKSFRRFYFFARLKGFQGIYMYIHLNLKKYALTVLRSTSSTVQSEIEKQVSQTISKIAQDMLIDVPSFTSLPSQPLTTEQLRPALQYRVSPSTNKLSGTVYHNDATVIQHQVMAFSLFNTTNPLHPDIFPGVRQMEAEILQMILHLFHAPPTGCGNLTSGGTESILMACKAYRDLANKAHPQMIIPVTAHAAFDKAGAYFNIELIKIPIQENGQVDLKQMKKAITQNTIMIVGSAPNFPHGIIDDLQGLSDIALKFKIPFHVDACLGSFLLPFLNQVHPNPPIFDFRLSGVTSISMDPHKYGLEPKGTSVILYRSNHYRKHQYFLSADWTGGIYGSPSMAGSRSGALIAGCWATMLSLGVPGYLANAKKVLLTAKEIAQFIQSQSVLHLIGDPLVSVVAFTSKPSDLIYHINDGMLKRHWHFNLLQHPPAIHLACTLLTHSDTFIQDLKETLSELDDERSNQELGQSQSQAIYGTAAKVDPSIVNEVVSGFLDLLTTDLSKTKAEKVNEA